MKVLLTGGAGFIGQYVASILTEQGHEVFALDCLLPQVHADPEASRRRFPGQLHVGDVSDPSAWDGLARADAIIHLAAETGTGQSMYEQDRYHRVNVGGTDLAGKTAADWGARLVSLSSRAVYGNGRHICQVHGDSYGTACCDRSGPAPSTETDPHRAVSFYGTTKSLAEQTLTQWGEHVPITSIRPQNVIGPGQALHNPYTGVLAAFLAQLKAGRPLTIYGTGLQTRDFLHVSDLARLLTWCVLEPASYSVDVLNAGSGVRTTLLELAQYAATASPAGRAEITHVEVTRAGDIDHACADLTRFHNVGAPAPLWKTPDAVADFIRLSWGHKGADTSAWDAALAELAARGLTS